MSHLPIAVLAYFLNACAVTIDKFLLTKKIANPLAYVFYFSVFSMIVLFLLPFTKMPDLPALVLASIATLMWTTGAFYLFKALKIGQVSRVIPIIGTLTPLIVFLQAYITQSVGINQLWAVGVLILGLVFLTFYDMKGKITGKELIYELNSSLLAASSYIVLHHAYTLSSFFDLFVWSRMILLPVGIIIMLIPLTRHQVFAKSGAPKLNFFSKGGLLFIIGQAAGGASELLLTYAISIATPALVNSLQGVQFACLFLFSILLAKKFPEIFKDHLSRLIFLTKIIGLVLLSIGLYILAFAGSSANFMETGLTYSPRYAQELGLDPKRTYTQMLDELKVKNVRIPVYWDEVENIEGQYRFTDVDFYLREAERRNVEVILGVGFKQPRWPECYMPEWAKDLSEDQRNEQIVKLVQTEVEHFKKYPAIKIWQVENEPFLNFGDCPKITDKTYDRVKDEVAMVKSLDPRPVMITDSGELSLWGKAVRLADVLGSTMYRTIWSPYFGLVDYPLPPFYYQIKAQIINFLNGNKISEFMVAELQAEPWQTRPIHLSEIPALEQAKDFPAKKLEQNFNYAKETGFSSSYFWGVEWWYFMKSKGHPEYVDEAKKIFGNKQ